MKNLLVLFAVELSEGLRDAEYHLQFDNVL